MAAGPCCGPIPNLSTTQLHDLSGRLAEPSAYGHRDSVPNSPSATGTVGLPAHRLKGAVVVPEKGAVQVVDLAFTQICGPPVDCHSSDFAAHEF